MPWPIVLVLIAGRAWFASRSSRIVADAAATMCLMNFLDMCKDRMKTISMIMTSTLLPIAI